MSTLKIIKTVKEARSLPEITRADLSSSFFGSQGLDGDSIMEFIDSDGKVKSVECIRRMPSAPDEWVKVG